MIKPAELTPLATDAPSETPAERLLRLAHEKRLIDEARADIAAGRYIEGEELDRWLDRWATEGAIELPDAVRGTR